MTCVALFTASVQRGYPMRLLYIVNQAGTFFSHRLPWARKAVNYGYEVHVAGPLGGAAKRIEALGFKAWDFPFVRGLGSPLSLARGLRAGGQVVRHVSPDVVHLVGTQVVATLGPLLSRKMAPALVASVTGLGHAFLTDGPKGALMRAVTTTGYAAVARHENSRFVFQNPDDLATIRAQWPLGLFKPTSFAAPVWTRAPSRSSQHPSAAPASSSPLDSSRKRESTSFAKP